MPARRLHFSTGQKIGLWLIALIWLWRGFHDPFIVEAILSFGLAGEVPGTSIVLSPEQVMLLAAGLIALIIGALFARRAVKRRSTTVDAIADLPSPLKVKAAPMVRPHVRQHTVTDRTMPAVEVKHRTWIGRLASAFVAKIKAAIPYIVWVGAIVVWACVTAVAHVRKYAIQLFWWTIARAVAFWKWLSPYLWKFDAWLGVQFHRGVKNTHSKVKQNDTASVLLDLVKHGKQSVQDRAARYRRN